MFICLLKGLEFSILELGLFWARSCGEPAGWGACLLLLWGPVLWSDFDC